MDSPNTFTIFSPPEYAGCWSVANGHFKVYALERPSRLHRFMNKFLIGWEWVDS